MTSSWIDLELTGLGLVFRMVSMAVFFNICGMMESLMIAPTFDTLSVEAIAVIDTLVDLKRLSSIQ